MQKFKGSMTTHEFTEVLQKQLQKQAGITVSLKVAWIIFRICMMLPYHITAKKGKKVVLAGLGKFQLYKTKAGNVIPKFYAGETPIRVLTMGLDILDFVMKPIKYRALRNTNPDGTLPASNPDEKPKKEVKKVDTATETKESEPEIEKPKKETKKSKTASKKAEIEEELQSGIDEDVDEVVADFDDFDDFEL